MTQIHADEVTVSGAVALQQILALKLVARVNQHATLQVRGYLDAAEYNKVIVKPMNGQTLTVTCSGELYFTGLILDIELSMENALHIANIQCISESYQFDTLKKSHSYQNKDMMYSAMLKQVSEGTGPILFLAKDKVIQKPIVQYQETDWEFTKRMASRFGTVVIPEIRYELPQISLGIVNGENYDVPETTEYIDGVRTSFYNKKKHLNPCRIGDFAYCRVKDRRIFQLGDKIAFHNQNWVVMEKEMWLERGLLNNLYTLGHEMGFGLAYYANERISGMSIMGNVIKTDAENVKLKLDIDKNHDSGEYWYRYTPQSGNLFYLMPKVGTRLALFFPDDEEENSTAMSSPRTNGRYMEDPSVRELLTEHYKRMTLAPKWLEFQGGTNLVQLADEKGISFNSQRPIEITANKVFFTASNQAIINANQEFVARKSKSENAIRIFGSEMHIYAPIRYLSGESKSFPPVKQIAQEEPNDGGLLGLVLGAVAVVAVGVIAGPEIALGCLLLGGCAFLLTGCPSRTVSSPDDSSSEDSDSSSSSSSSSSEVTSGDEPSSGPDEDEAGFNEEVSAKTELNEEVLKDILLELGWSEDKLTDTNINDLYDAITEFDINTNDRLAHFLSQVSEETNYGQWTVELGSAEYLINNYWTNQAKAKELGNTSEWDAVHYSGGGYIQLTGRANYQAFSDYMDSIGRSDPDIMNEGREVIAKKYPWLASAYWWKTNGINDAIDNGANVLDVSRKCNIGPNATTGTPNHLEERIEAYEKVTKILEDYDFD